MNVHVVRVAMNGPSDLSGVKRVFDEGVLQPASIIAVVTKTEGNGCVNDFTRGYGTFAVQVLLSEALGVAREEVARRVAIVMSGGTEGVLSPHMTLFARVDQRRTQPGAKRLAVGVSHTRDFLPEEIGRMPQILEVAGAVRQAMVDAGVASIEDVHFVQIKCPLLTSERMEEARRRGQTVATVDTYESMSLSRGASALGTALALGEVDASKLSNEAVCEDWSLYSSVASTSAGIELMNCEIVLMGNSAASTSDFTISHSVMKDAIDGSAVRDALRSSGIQVVGEVSPEQAGRIVNVFAKAEADPGGYLRGRRHTMLNDSDINSTRHARAVVGGVIASVVGDPMIYVSGGAEHQGPPGGGPVAVIVRAEEK